MRAIVLAALLLPTLANAETCRFTGTTSHAGRLAATVTTTQANGDLTIDVTIAFAITALASDVKYYGQEISIWRGRQLRTLAVNQRTIVDDSIKRQQWDVFRRNDRAPGGPTLEAYRVQAKRLVDFRPHHPGFVQHWSPTAFGHPWLQDFQQAPPDRRPDLDLPAAPSTQAPLALAFYWSRFLPDQGESAAMVLPGFKQDKTVQLRLSPATPGDAWRRWSTPLIHPGLDAAPASLAAAWVSPQNYLMQLGFEVHTTWASGQAFLRPEGCQGIQLRPD